MTRRRVAGTVLLEALVATLLLVASAWLVAVWQREAARDHQMVLQRALAHALAHAQLDSLEASLQGLASPESGEDIPTTTPELGLHRRWWTEHDPDTGLTLLRVEVEWPGPQGQRRRLERRRLVFLAGHWEDPR